MTRILMKRVNYDFSPCGYITFTLLAPKGIFLHLSPHVFFLTLLAPNVFFLTLLAPKSKWMRLVLGAKMVRKKDVEDLDVKIFLFGLKG
ncbi:hypothetical protein HanIR_Chr10g0459251 [Helianthus annuus]|nr:hypothetical protein HanIR_Chr10g0459251 [Helianthus annuus]